MNSKSTPPDAAARTARWLQFCGNAPRITEVPVQYTQAAIVCTMLHSADAAQRRDPRKPCILAGRSWHRGCELHL